MVSTKTSYSFIKVIPFPYRIVDRVISAAKGNLPEELDGTRLYGEAFFIRKLFMSTKICTKTVLDIADIWENLYNPVFDSYKTKKSLYPLILLGVGDFLHCFKI